MPLDNEPILVMCDAVETANAIVACISEARGDIVFAANGVEALQRLRQFQFDVAVLARQGDTQTVAAAPEANGVPYLVFGQPMPDAAAAELAPVIADIEQVVSTLVILQDTVAY